jgi:hypothetical protein
MRKVVLPALLAAVMLLSACTAGSGEKAASTDSETGSDETAASENSETGAVTESTAPLTAEAADGKLDLSNYGRYSGQYVEDGSDDAVENVAVILVTNNSQEYLEYALITYDIDGTAASFAVSGLPAGRAAWVLESNRLTVSDDAVFTYQEDVSSFQEPEETGVTAAAGNGYITVQNSTNKALSEISVFYKRVYEDGNFLGGIAYRASIGALEPGQCVDATAGHSTSDGCEIVKISATKGES